MNEQFARLLPQRRKEAKVAVCFFAAPSGGRKSDVLAPLALQSSNSESLRAAAVGSASPTW
jgi:hypothetical protein